MKNHEQSSFDGEVIKAIVGGILIIVIPLLLIFGYSKYFGGESCDADCAYGRKMIEQRSDQEPEPTDYNGDGTITRDEAEDDPETSELYDCTSNCSGHQAGYEWARSNNICDPSYTGGKSQSFSEGVQAWALDGC